jgi:opacity protein-like surface antigen
MRKLMTLALLISLFAMPAFALDFTAKQFYVQGVVALPMGTFGDIANLGFGGGVGILVPHNDMLSFGLEASYLTYSTEDQTVLGVTPDVSMSMIPVLALVHYNMTDSPLYLLGGIGLAFGHSKVEYNGFSASDNSSDFDIALGAGYEATPNLFFEGRINLVSDANQIEGHIGYKF